MTRPQEIRKEALTLLYSARPIALSAAAMERKSKQWGNDYQTDEFTRECEFLVGQGMVRKETFQISGETMFSITSAGIIAYEASA